MLLAVDDSKRQEKQQNQMKTASVTQVQRPKLDVYLFSYKKDFMNKSN